MGNIMYERMWPALRGTAAFRRGTRKATPVSSPPIRQGLRALLTASRTLEGIGDKIRSARKGPPSRLLAFNGYLGEWESMPALDCLLLSAAGRRSRFAAGRGQYYHW